MVPCVAEGDPFATVELFCEDHVAVLGDSHWVLRERSSRCGLRLDLMLWSLVAASLGVWLSVGCWVISSVGCRR